MGEGVEKVLEWVLERFQSRVGLTNEEVQLPQQDLDESEDKWEDAAEVGGALTHQLLQDSHCVLEVHCLDLDLGEASLKVACDP